MKSPRWENEVLTNNVASGDFSQCNKCRWRAADREYNGKVVFYGYKSGKCAKYDFQKPAEIINGTQACPFKDMEA